MIVRIYKDKSSLAENAAKKAAVVVRQVLSQNGKATIVVATGNSQIDFLNALTQEPEIDWGKTTFFHLDNYIGLPEHHPASFHDYLMSRIVRRVHPRVFHFIRGNTDPATRMRTDECAYSRSVSGSRLHRHRRERAYCFQ